MPMNYEDRAKAARTPSNPFPLRVQTALVKHARYVLAQGETPDNVKTLARQVLMNREHYSILYALPLLTDPAYDDIESVFDIADDVDEPGSMALQQKLAGRFADFAAPEAD